LFHTLHPVLYNYLARWYILVYLWFCHSVLSHQDK
jgi:hypothetical protein